MTLLPRNHLASVKPGLGIVRVELLLAAPKPIIVRWAPGGARDTFRSSGVSRKLPQRELLFEVTTNGSVTVAAPRLRYTGMYPVSSIQLVLGGRSTQRHGFRMASVGTQNQLTP
jgi:hypothetical protein